mmetsp:Transcript_55188/g.103636  ORF Transcript_55188/g.103636 Transcript_55188/m.103636 type:complete len:226 (-) Transcript_55188:940-1617(-)
MVCVSRDASTGTTSIAPWPSSSCVMPTSVSTASGSTVAACSISQGCARTSVVLFLIAASGISMSRRQSQQRQEISAGLFSSIRGHFLKISSTSIEVLTLVAWCGSVIVMPVAPGPRYVVNSGCPVVSWITVIPELHTSHASVCTPFEPKISGAIYWKVPARLEGWSLSSAHHPKSAIFSTPSPVINKFSGLMSRWRMPELCRSLKPMRSWRVKSNMSLSRTRLPG